ncbi:MAG: tetratricopeptide repeat protein [Sphingomonadales bacterium]
MKKIIPPIVALLLAYSLGAQEIAVRDWQLRALDFNNRGDHSNAVIVLQQALKQHPRSLALEKDLTTSLLLKRDFAAARQLALTMVERPDADEACFQLGGNALKALEEVKECEKLYAKGIKKFPTSGPLYSELGELLWASKDKRAITYWEDGIRTDPNYAGNYYNAAIYYSKTDLLWRTLLYGEIYVNMESKSERVAGIKKLLWQTYQQKVMTPTNGNSKPAAVEVAIASTFDKGSSVLIQGFTGETLTMARTRFVLEWFKQYGERYPFRLFDHHQQLLKAGLFDAYNQWLWGEVENKSRFEQWKKENVEVFEKLESFLFNRVFKLSKYPYLF